MLRYAPFALLIASSVGLLSCADDTVVATGRITVEWDENADFTQYETFSVVTENVIPPGGPEIPPDAMLFNQDVNDFIIEAMESEPVCLKHIDPADPVDPTDPSEPDVWAANGLSQSEEGGWTWQCVGGWWWGYWGWYWDPCKWISPIYVEVEVGSLLIPVGPPPVGDEDPQPTFVGLAQSLDVPGPGAAERVQAAVNAIFSQWPDKRQCE